VSPLRASSTGTFYIRDPPFLLSNEIAGFLSYKVYELAHRDSFTRCFHLVPYDPYSPWRPASIFRSRYIGPLIHICIENKNKSRDTKRVCSNTIERPHSRNEGSPANAQPCKLQSLQSHTRSGIAPATGGTRYKPRFSLSTVFSLYLVLKLSRRAFIWNSIVGRPRLVASLTFIYDESYRKPQAHVFPGAAERTTRTAAWFIARKILAASR